MTAIHTRSKVVRGKSGGKRLALAAVAAVLGVSLAHGDVTLSPGETLDWDASTPAADAVIEATGGTIVFNSDATVQNSISLGGEVTVTVNNGASVRFAKTISQTDPSGRLVLPCTVRFGSTDLSKYAFLPENAIAFAAGASGAKLRLAGYVSLLALPDRWGNPIPYECDSGAQLTFYGGNMVTDAAYTVPSGCAVRMTSPTNFAAATVITVPASSTLQDRPATFNPATGAGSGINSDTTTVCSNDVVLSGGSLRIMNAATHHFWGGVSGTGTITVSADAWPSIARNVYTHFYGGVGGMDAQSVLAISQYDDGSYSMNNGCRLASDFAGTVRMRFNLSRPNIISFGFAVPGGSGKTNEVWNVGALKGGSLIGPRNGEGGARLQFSAKQHIHVGTLSGKLAIFATESSQSVYNTDDLTADVVADDTEIYVKNGIRLHFGTVGKGVKIRYMASPVSSNVLEVASGTIEEISFLADQRTKPVYLNGGVGLVTGPGKVVAADGSRVGFVGAESEVAVNSGSVEIGDGELFGSKPALWFDASDLSTFAPLYKDGYQAGYHNPSYLLGADKPAAVYTNDYPLVEKWYDKRTEQRLNFFWNNRWQDAETFYPQFYPFIVTNGLGGKPILSFGINRSFGLSTEWNQTGVPGGGTGASERRRMHLMQSATEGHAVYVHTCVMVFGSERGGGRCIFGGYNGYTSGGAGVVTGQNPSCSDHFLRTGTGYGVGNGIFQAKDGSLYETWVNGTSVVCTNTPMSGSWDVISFNTDKAGSGGRAFRNIGSPQNVDNAGGQDYAEFLVYTNKLTDTERMIVESYLARKWGLTGKQAASAGTVSVGAGATVTGGQANVAGSGTWALRAFEEVALDGSFTGTIGGAGKVTAAQAASLAPSFSGALAVAGGDLSFTYSNGAFSPALVAENADLSFPASATVTISTGGAKLPQGDYVLVQGKTLAGLTDLTLVHDMGKGRDAKLVRTETSLVLRVTLSGMIVFIR
ncbi:MAG: hypothetical protein II840_02765 [Kiritimatiellae bacterium]|nr:hypothetical protein [Kiritimatiellia bacterium]